MMQYEDTIVITIISMCWQVVLALFAEGLLTYWSYRSNLPMTNHIELMNYPPLSIRVMIYQGHLIFHGRGDINILKGNNII